MDEAKRYKDYLLSPEWKQRRDRILKRDKYQCQMCGTGKNLEVHHIRYPDVLGDESDEDLITVCDKCHKKIHAHDSKERDKYWHMKRSTENWVDETKVRDFLYDGPDNMCSLELLKESNTEYCRKHNCKTRGVSYLQGSLGYAHWKLVTEMYHQGYTPEEIYLITPLDKQKILSYLGKDRSKQEEHWNGLIPLSEINMFIDWYIRDDQKRRKPI